MPLFRTLRFRITAAATALVTATLVLASIAILTLVRADLMASAEAALDEALWEQAVALESAYGNMAVDTGFDSNVMSDVIGLADLEVEGQEVQLGTFLQDSDGMAYSEVLVDDEPFATLVLDPASGEIVELIDPWSGHPLEDAELASAIDGYQFDAIEPDFSSGESVGFDTSEGDPLVVGATPLAAIDASVDALQEALFLTVPVLLVAFAALAWWLVGRALRPVVAITAQVSEISSASLDQRVPVPTTGDEVSQLAVVMNHMLGRLQRGDERQRQFSADASHELRSPLATLRTAAELIERHPDPERAKRLAADMVLETDRMDDLIGDLLELARLDEQRDSDKWETVDLVDLAEAEAARAELDGRTNVKVLAGGPVSTVGSSRQLRRLVANLVDNACHHARTTVVVSVESLEDGGQELLVEDDGSGIPPERAEEIFERFSRLSEARDRRSGGTGLGLSLVKAIAVAHDAEVTVGSSSQGGAAFTVRFPAAGVKQ